MTATPLLSLEAVREWVGDLEIGKGRPYAKGAAVSGCVLEGKLLKACVKGTRTRPYRVWVQPSGGAVVAAGCTCPVGRSAPSEKGKCKHIAATLLAYLESPNRFVKLSDIYTDLESREKPELIALILQMIQRSPEVEPLLAAPLPGILYRTKVPPDFYFWQTAEMIRGVNMANDRAAREMAEWVIEMLEDNFAFDHNNQGQVFEAVLAGVARALHEELTPDVRERVLNELPDDLRWTLASPPKEESGARQV
ncbi:MAG: SWIM zinc finger family protein [Planctomycetia bacterium]|nr:SWIM zinc finger family protein [Planctomycetia bacterium]